MASMPLEKRLRIYERDGYRCQACGFTTTRERTLELIEKARLRNGRFPHRELLTIDHVWPRSLGGGSNDENLQTLCAPCNHAKGDRAPDGRPVVAAPTRSQKRAARRAARAQRPKPPPTFASIANRLHRPGYCPVLGCVPDCHVRQLSAAFPIAQ